MDDDLDSVEAFAESLCSATESFSETEISADVMQDARTGGFFYEVNSAQGRFLVMVTAIEDDEDDAPADSGTGN